MKNLLSKKLFKTVTVLDWGWIDSTPVLKLTVGYHRRFYATSFYINFITSYYVRSWTGRDADEVIRSKI